MTEVPVCDSLRCVFKYFFRDSWLGSGSSCLLDGVASYAADEVCEYGSQDSQVSAQSKKENKRRQSSICCKRMQTLGLSSVQFESAIVVPSFPIS